MNTCWLVISATFLILNLTQRVASQDKAAWCSRAYIEEPKLMCNCCWYILGLFPVYALVECIDIPSVTKGPTPLIRQPVLITAVKSGIAFLTSWVGGIILTALVQFIASIRV